MHKQALALLMLLLAGCSFLQPGPPALVLLPPASLEQEISVLQQLQAVSGQQQHQLLIALTVDKQEINMTGMAATGQRLFNIRYDGHSIETEHLSDSFVDINAQQVLAQVQLTYWPLNHLRKHYKQHWTLTESAHQRQLQLHNQPFVTIDYANHSEHKPFSASKEISLYHHPLDIQLDITTLRVHIQGDERPHE